MGTWLVKNFFHQPKKLPRNKKFCADKMEGDAELNALRQKRMAEMQAQGGGPMGGGGGDQQKKAQVENAIIQMAQSGQLGGKLSEEELIGLLERFAGSTKKSSVNFDRRRNALDSDDD